MSKEIKNLEEVAQRIKRAIKDKERIILYGDADVDGISSVIILKETIKSIGGNIGKIYFPNREKEGYGLNKNALNNLSNLSPALFITLDCGISNFEEVKMAKDLGFEVIIIDHHEVLGKFPEADIIVDPKRKDEEYPFSQFSNAAIIFRLSQLLLKDKEAESLRNNFIELAALSTLADMMPELEDNEAIIQEGLAHLGSSWRPGIKVFFEMEEIKDYISTRQAVQKIISALNAGENKENLHESYFLLTASSEKEAKVLASSLFERARERKFKIQEIVQEVEDRIQSDPSNAIIFEGSHSWPFSLMGPIASRICAIFKKPTFIFKKNEKESQGAVRMPKGLNGVTALISCKDFLKTFGGHPPAAGFRIENSNLEDFEKCLSEYFSNL